MVCFQTHIFGSMYSYLYPITKCTWLDKCMPTGYTIPFGWAIMLVNSALQLNPNIYKDPLAFNPWRWKVCDYNLVRRNEWSNQYYCCLFREIPLTTFFFFFFFINGTRILTHWLYLRISCLLDEELDNVQGRSILKRSWLHSSMFWSPNIGNLLRFMI